MYQEADLSDRYLLAGKFRSLQRDYARAIEVFSEGIERFPADARLYRHRGHRRLNVRQYQAGLDDLRTAADLIEGQPDEFDWFTAETADDIERLQLARPILNQHLQVTSETIETTSSLFKSTLHFSVYYHLALAHFLLHQYEQALTNYRRALQASVDDDARSAVNDWIYMTLLRLGRHSDAAAHLAEVDAEGYQINEETPLYVNRLRLYKGELSADELRQRASAKPLAMVTAEFAIGQWHLNAGRMDEARACFEKLLAHGDRHSFAYLVAERDHQDIQNANIS